MLIHNLCVHNHRQTIQSEINDIMNKIHDMMFDEENMFDSDHPLDWAMRAPPTLHQQLNVPRIPRAIRITSTRC